MTTKTPDRSDSARPGRLERVVSDRPPNDGWQWLPHCARCGNEMEFEQCEQCDDGFDGHDCGEDCCCCLHPDENVPCQICLGQGGWYVCVNSEAWCKGNPLPGREQTERGTIEWRVDEDR